MRTSERQLFRARFAWLCNWLLSDVCDGGHFTVTVVCLPAALDEVYHPLCAPIPRNVTLRVHRTLTCSDNLFQGVCIRAHAGIAPCDHNSRLERDQQPMTNNQQPRTNRQRATSSKQQAASSKQQATSNKQHATRNTQHATNNEQYETRNKQRATSNEQRATSKEQRAASNEHRSTSNKHRSTSNKQQQ